MDAVKSLPDRGAALRSNGVAKSKASPLFLSSYNVVFGVIAVKFLTSVLPALFDAVWMSATTARARGIENRRN